MVDALLPIPCGLPSRVENAASHPSSGSLPPRLLVVTALLAALLAASLTAAATPATAAAAPAAALPAAAAEDLETIYATRNWAQVLSLADRAEPSPESDFWAARALRNMGRHEEARQRYLGVLKADPKHPRAADAGLEAALMLVSELQQVAHGPAERALAERAAREMEEVLSRHADSAQALARAAYIAGNTWKIAGQDERAAAAYERAVAAGDAGYAAKALDKHAELAFSRLEVERARSLWEECIARHETSPAASGARRALERLALAGRPAPPLEVELWAKGPPISRDDLEGGVSLLYAFAVWCEHCKRELPHAADLLETYRDSGFQVIGLTANRKTQTTADVFAFVEDRRYRMDYPVAVDDERRTTSAYWLTGLPSAALVDRKGLIRWVGHPNDLSNRSIEALLDEPAPRGEEGSAPRPAPRPDAGSKPQ